MAVLGAGRRRRLGHLLGTADRKYHVPARQDLSLAPTIVRFEPRNPAMRTDAVICRAHEGGRPKRRIAGTSDTFRGPRISGQLSEVPRRCPRFRECYGRWTWVDRGRSVTEEPARRVNSPGSVVQPLS